MMPSISPLLKLDHLQIRYGSAGGGILAVKGISMEIQAGELVTLIGANGAGKTTTLKAISRQLPWASGDIQYQGHSLRKRSSFHLLRRGLALVPEGRGVFTRLSILENLQMGAYIRNDTAGILADIEKMFVLFPRLKERAQQLAGTLSGGEQQMLAMARALMSQPKLLLLDEPSMGLSPRMVEKIFEVICNISAHGVTILLVEQNANLALQIAHRAYVMESGLIHLSGNAKDLLADSQVRAAYLGE